jgi:hypothetical protein
MILYFLVLGSDFLTCVEKSLMVAYKMGNSITQKNAEYAECSSDSQVTRVMPRILPVTWNVI